MDVKHITPILNVSNILDSFAWFEKLGWRKCWDWGTPPTFGAVGAGKFEIFLCENGQGGRGKTGAFDGDGSGVWMSVWVDDVDTVHTLCLEKGVEVISGPRDEPWQVREMQIRHPDGHVFRISKPIEI